MGKWDVPDWQHELKWQMKLVREEFLELRREFVRSRPRYASEIWIKLNRKLVIWELHRLRLKGFSVAEKEIEWSD